MPDDARTVPVTGESARRSLEYLGELCPNLRGAALIDAEGAPLACSGGGGRFGEVAVEMVSAADRAEGRPFEVVHVAGGDGEVFAVRDRGLVLIAVTARNVLASLLGFDMRMVLRDLLRESGAPGGNGVGRRSGGA